MNRKEAILQAAVELFAERGFSATPTSAVAKLAGVAEGLIFHYFRNKEGIFVHILKDMIDRYIQGIERAVRKDVNGLKAIEKIVSFHYRFSRENSKAFLVIIRDFPFSMRQPGSDAQKIMMERTSRIYDLIGEALERGRRDGSIREVSVRETALVIRGLLVGTCRLSMLAGQDLPNLHSEALEFCVRGLAAHA